MDPTIGDYIRANADRYTPEAIRAQLTAAGHDAGEVDAALAAFAAQRSAQQTSGRAFATYVWVVYGIGIAIIFLFTGVGMGLLGVGWLAAYAALGYLAGRRMSRIATPTSAGGWVGVILLAPIAFLLIGGGICAATIAVVMGLMRF